MDRITALIDSVVETSAGWRKLLPSCGSGSTINGMTESQLAAKVAQFLREQADEAEELSAGVSARS